MKTRAPTFESYNQPISIILRANRNCKFVFYSSFYATLLATVGMKKEENEDKEIEEVFKKLQKEGYSKKASEAIYDWYHR